jgi:uncharacterized protein (UPF0333 family)
MYRIKLKGGMMSFIKDSKGQGALEYLLIIGGAILVAAIAVAILVNVSKQSSEDVSSTQDSYNSALTEGEELLQEQLDE